MTTFELNSRRESILQQMAELLNNEEAITKAERWIKECTIPKLKLILYY
ncbi:hypothetical protein [Parabacteroides johnsonii]|nr:hypothetical protein [Parabacteroides johnsonii]MBV4245758.1 hypothetical protein [Parabacteroides johnsonii]